MSSVASPAGLVHVGMDTSKKTIMIATLWPGEQVPAAERIANGAVEPPVVMHPSPVLRELIHRARSRSLKVVSWCSRQGRTSGSSSSGQYC
jgi:hypothetical protein